MHVSQQEAPCNPDNFVAYQQTVMDQVCIKAELTFNFFLSINYQVETRRTKNSAKENIIITMLPCK